MSMAEWFDDAMTAVTVRDMDTAKALFRKIRLALHEADASTPVAAHRAIDLRAEPERTFLRKLMGDAIGAAFLAHERLDAAEGYLEDAATEAQARDPFDGVDYARVADLLGKLYGRQQRRAYALECANRCLAQRTKLLPADDPQLALAHLQVGALRWESGEWQPARQHLGIAFQMLHGLGPDWSTPYAIALFASLHATVQAGELDVAEKTLAAAPGVDERIDAETDTRRFPALVLLAVIRDRRGAAASALELARRAAAVAGSVTQNELWRPLYLALADLLATRAAPAEAVRVLDAVATTDRIRAQLLLDTAFFSQRIIFSDALAAATGELVRLVLDKLPRDADAAAIALRVVMERKALLTEADQTSNRRAAAFGGLGADAQIRELDDLASELRRTEMAGAFDGHEKLHAAVAALKRRIRECESRFSAALPADAFPAAARIDLGAIRSQLGAGCVLIEYVALRAPRDDPSAAIEPDLVSEVACERYAAFVLAPDADVTLVDLGPAAPIEDLVYSYLAVVNPAGPLEIPRDRRARCLPGDAASLGAQLREKIFDPVAAVLPRTAECLRIAPDGAITAVAFAALPRGDRESLIDRFEVSYLTSGRVLLRPPEESGGPGGAVVIADPDYDGGALPAAVDPQAPPDFWFARLPNSAREAAQVARRIGGRLACGAAATRAALLEVRSPVALHVATHGFFLPPYARGFNVIGDWRNSGMGLTLRGDVLSFSDEPLLRSGLAFAGVNAWSAGQETDEERGDGLVMARDVLRLDLRHTRLVFLSACSTARGTIRPGEGSAGLLQSFVAAGARSIVAALWATADHPATVTFVDRFYARLAAGDTVPAALRYAQRELRQLGAPLWVWAAFAAHGDPRVTLPPS